MSKTIGDIGESIAKNYLIEKGWSILDTNVFSRFGEIDIVATYQSTLGFFEVKHNGKAPYMNPLFKFSKSKQLKCIKTIFTYCQRHNIPFYQTDISLELIIVCKGKVTQHLESVILDEFLNPFNGVYSSH